MPDQVKRWTHWTTDEVGRLRELIARGATYRAAGRALNRTHAAVKYKCDHLGLEYSAETGWPAADKEKLRELIEAGLSHRDAATLLGRPYRSVKMMAYNMGLRTSTTVWTAEQNADLETLYGTMPARELAAKIGKPLAAVYRRADLRGLTGDRPAPFSDAEQARIRELNAAGQPDTHIAADLGRDRHTTSKERKRLGLPSHARGEVWKANISKGVARQVQRLGLKGMADLKAASYRAFARQYNLPETLGPRAVRIVLALAQHGPLTRKQLAEATGADPCMLDNSAGTSYTSSLIRQGLLAYVFRKEGARRLPGHYVLTAAALDLLAVADRKEPLCAIG